MCTNRLMIDGVEFTKNVVKGLNELELEYGFYDNTFGYNTSTSITLNKEGYEYIKEKYFSDCEGIHKTSVVKYYNCCCDLWLDLDLDFEDVSICPLTCNAKITISSIDDAISCYQYLCSKVIGQDGYSEAAKLMQFWFRIQGGIFNRFLFIFLPTINILLITIASVIKSLEIICLTLNGLPGVNLDCPSYVNLDTFTCALSRYVAGVGQYHVGVSLTEALEYYINKCGLTLQSSILQHHPQYSCLAIILSTGARAQDKANNPQWWQRNVPTKSVKDILDELAEKVFNAEWIIKDGVLYFERKDIIEGYRNPLFKLEDVSDRVVSEMCIEFTSEKAPAFLEFDWCADGKNTEGEIQARCYSGNVEWNPEGAYWKRDSKKVEVECFTAHVRGMFDTSLLRDESNYKWDIVFDLVAKGEYRKALNISPELGFFTAGASYLLSGLVCDLTEDCALVMSGDVTDCTPLVVFDKTSPNSKKTVIKRDTGVELYGCKIYEYNYPLSVIKQNDDETFARGQLYNEFWDICNPNRKGRELYDVKELKIKLNCEEIKAIHESPCGWYIDSDYGKINTDDIKINTKTNVATFEAATIRCIK